MSKKKKIVIIGNTGIGKSLAHELANNKCGLPIVIGSSRHPKCAGRQCNHPLDPPEFECGYNTTIECEECKYCIGAMGTKDPEAKCNQQK